MAECWKDFGTADKPVVVGGTDAQTDTEVDTFQYAERSGVRVLVTLDQKATCLLEDIRDRLDIVQRHLEEITCHKFDSTDTR